MKINDPNWVPCYMNPTFEEIVELAKSKWDTCRILVNGGDFVIASGYGNTHTSIAERYRIAKNRKKGLLSDPFILFHSNRIAYMNLEDVSGKQYAGYEEWSKVFDDAHVEVLEDLIRESGLAL